MPKSLSAELLLINPSLALQQSYQVEKQQDWGKFTYLCILLAQNQLKQNKIKTLMELFNLIADCRSLIGAILSHDKGTGKPRQGIAWTPILSNPYSPYCDQLPEFKAWYLQLKQLSQKTEKSIKLKGQLIHEEKNIEYDRSTVTQEGENHFTLFHNPSIGSTIFQAQSAFARLFALNSDLMESEREVKIRELLNQILFFTADAMLYNRGTPSIAQQAYHALEYYFFSSYSYFNKPRSKYQHTEGLSFDLAAMLSSDFTDFNDYLMKNIIDPSVKVKPVTLEEIQKAAKFNGRTKDELLDFITRLKTHLIAIESQYHLYHPFIYSLQAQQCKRYSEGFQLLNNLIEKKGEDEFNLAILQMFFERLLLAIQQDHTFYPDFYKKLADKSIWPEPALPPFPSIESMLQAKQSTLSDWRWFTHSIRGRNAVLSPFIRSLQHLQKFCQAIHYSQDYSNNYIVYVDYEETGDICKNLIKCSQSLTADDSLDLLAGHLKKLTGESQPFARIVSYYLHFVGKLKTLPTPSANLIDRYNRVRNIYPLNTFTLPIAQDSVSYYQGLLAELYKDIWNIDTELAECQILWEFICPSLSRQKITEELFVNNIAMTEDNNLTLSGETRTFVPSLASTYDKDATKRKAQQVLTCEPKVKKRAADK